MISVTARYALLALVHLVRHREPQTARAIAEATGVPTGYLVKILQMYVRAGVVESRRGPHGGYSLVDGAERRSVDEIVAVAEPQERQPCVEGEDAGHDPCPLCSLLDEVVEASRERLRGVALADLAAADHDHGCLGRRSAKERLAP